MIVASIAYVFTVSILVTYMLYRLVCLNDRFKEHEKHNKIEKESVNRDMFQMQREINCLQHDVEDLRARIKSNHADLYQHKEE